MADAWRWHVFANCQAIACLFLCNEKEILIWFQKLENCIKFEKSSENKMSTTPILRPGIEGNSGFEESIKYE